MMIRILTDEERKASHALSMKRYYENNKEKIKRQQKEYRKENKDKIYAKQKEWRAANSEKTKAFMRNSYYKRKKLETKEE